MALSEDAALPPFIRLVAHPLRWRLLTALARSDLRVRELARLVDEPQNLVSYHLRLLRRGELVTTARSSFDGRDSYYHLDLDRCARALAGVGAALHPALRPDLAAPPAPVGRVTVLFVCTGNSARSPIAEALLRRGAGGGARVEVASAGTRPKPRMHPDAVRVLGERYGIDIAGQRPRGLDTVTRQRFDHVITLCDRAREVCPGSPRHWSIPEPVGYPAFERAAADIDTRVRHLLPVLHREATQ